MGKWTLGSYDDILRDKMKSMIMSAVKRARLEEGQPAISYEAFVQELDTCDSFTSSMIDILVKEVADRRTRSSAVDRRLISQRTADCLRTQGGTRHIYGQYQGWTGRSRRTYVQPVFSTPFSDEEEDTSTEPLHAPEGVRVNSDLYDAYRPLDIQVEATQETAGTRDSERALEMVLSPRPRASSPIPLMTARRPIVGPSGSSLVRQNTIRRSTRTRVPDFTDFTSHRRSVVRQSREQNADSIGPEESADGTWRFLSTQEHSEPEAGTSSTASRRRPRRFFPLSAWSDPHLRIDHDGRSTRESTVTPPQPPIFPPSESQSSAALWYNLTAGSPPSTSPVTGPSRTDDGEVGVPRLRRGSLVAPEALLSRLTPTPAEEFSAELTARNGAAMGAEDTSTETEQRRESEVTQLLTPRSAPPLADS